MATPLNAIAQAETLKGEGNDHFKRRQYDEAVCVYTAALDLLCGAADSSEALPVVAAVRLNRAWALLEMEDGDGKRLRMAESDCSEALAMDANCVKALYRRALARERLGDFGGAMADAVCMKALEPANPVVGPLLQRLEPLVSTRGTPSKVAPAEDALAAKMDRVSIAEASIDTSQRLEKEKEMTKAGADAVWRALQEEERSLRRAIIKVAPKHHQTRSRSATSKPKPKTVSHGGGEISAKTDALWALLGEEEACTMAKAFSHSTRPKRGPKAD